MFNFFLHVVAGHWNPFSHHNNQMKNYVQVCMMLNNLKFLQLDLYSQNDDITIAWDYQSYILNTQYKDLKQDLILIAVRPDLKLESKNIEFTQGLKSAVTLTFFFFLQISSGYLFLDI